VKNTVSHSSKAATAHKLARVVYGMIKAQKNYAKKEAFTNPQDTVRQLKTLRKQASALGFTLAPAA
jgi:hypothetical protein